MFGEHCQYLGYMKYMDRDKFDTIKINSKKDLLDFAQKRKLKIIGFYQNT